MTRIQFKEFSKRWNVMLARYRIEPPLHMSDFSGSGKYAGWYPEMKRAVFWDASKLINEHKLYSISIAISQLDFKSELRDEVRKVLIGPYAFAFFVAIASHQAFSETMKSGPYRTSFLVDTGFGYQDQLIAAHSVIVNLEKRSGSFRHTGALAFDSDDDIPALQAADVIASASRKRQVAGTLPEGFEPLDEVLNEERITPHKHIPIPKDGIKLFADPVNVWISKKGAIPNLSDVVVRRLR